MTAWEPKNDAQRAVYDYYLHGGRRGDLVKHFKCGRLGVQKPEPSREAAFAAWMAGRAAAARGGADR